MPASKSTYIGRIAPTPTGHLHLGHGRTFWVAWARARKAGGRLVYREEDLDPDRCQTRFAEAAREDLRWLGLDWDHGPDSPGGGDTIQSQRHAEGIYLAAWQRLQRARHIYPCHRSRREIASVARPADHPDQPDEEPVFPVPWRLPPEAVPAAEAPGAVNWRFRVPDGEVISFYDGGLGPQSFVAGEDFGDFVIWRKNGFPSYELAVVVDDAAMEISEVVRGEDLIKSTARQILLYRALGLQVPRFFHCPLVRDAAGRRLAKRARDQGLCQLRAQGITPESLRRSFAAQLPHICD